MEHILQQSVFEGRKLSLRKTDDGEHSPKSMSPASRQDGKGNRPRSSSSRQRLGHTTASSINKVIPNLSPERTEASSHDGLQTRVLPPQPTNTPASSAGKHSTFSRLFRGLLGHSESERKSRKNSTRDPIPPAFRSPKHDTASRVEVAQSLRQQEYPSEDSRVESSIAQQGLQSIPNDASIRKDTDLQSLTELEIIQAHVHHSRLSSTCLEELVRRRACEQVPPATGRSTGKQVVAKPALSPDIGSGTQLRRGSISDWTPPADWGVPSSALGSVTQAQLPRLRDPGSLASVDENSPLKAKSEGLAECMSSGSTASQARKDSAMTQSLRKSVGSSRKTSSSSRVMQGIQTTALNTARAETLGEVELPGISKRKPITPKRDHSPRYHASRLSQAEVSRSVRVSKQQRRVILSRVNPRVQPSFMFKGETPKSSHCNDRRSSDE
jgi:hypothetical protein